MLNQDFSAYLAVAGGFDTPKIFGSSATVVRNKLGGLSESQGSAIQKGDVLPVPKLTNTDVKNELEFNWVPRFLFLNILMKSVCL
ncbi:hypothetical protein P4S64_06260 [Vibrio sp. M60_M31a]